VGPIIADVPAVTQPEILLSEIAAGGLFCDLLKS
jgi:hypothetical protein